MSDLYLWLRTLHILSATILFGAGVGTAYLMWRADRSADTNTVVVTARHVVAADWTFTVPAVIVQPLSGAWLWMEVGYPLGEGWLLLALGLYVVAIACWIPVVWIQIRVRDLAEVAHAAQEPLPLRYRRLMRAWFALGWPALVAMLAIFYLMVFKPDL